MLSARAPPAFHCRLLLLLPSLLTPSRARRRGVRTSPALIDALSGELHAARTLGEVRSGLAALRQRLLTTGVYRDVAVSLQPGAAGGGADVALELDELSYSVSQGFATDAAGTGGMSAVRCVRRRRRRRARARARAAAVLLPT